MIVYIYNYIYNIYIAQRIDKLETWKLLGQIRGQHLAYIAGIYPIFLPWSKFGEFLCAWGIVISSCRVFVVSPHEVWTSIIWMTRAPFFPCLDHGTDGSPNMVQDWSLVLYTGYIRVYILYIYVYTPFISHVCM